MPVPEVPPSQEEDAFGFDWLSSDAIVIPQSKTPPKVHVDMVADKVKTRAETQINMDLTLEPLPYDYLRFPTQCLAKPKQQANAVERAEIEDKNVLEMGVKLVVASAIEKPEDEKRALRRAAGLEPMPKREPDVQVSELAKDDERHPQNGGEVVICRGCRERERKRYGRKKKKGPDDDQFARYANEHVIMINEKEYKKFNSHETTGGQQILSPTAKHIDFAMRITCYCRHQEDKNPKGFRVIFTFVDPSTNAIVAQHISEVFTVTDDHKTRENVIYETTTTITDSCAPLNPRVPPIMIPNAQVHPPAIPDSCVHPITPLSQYTNGPAIPDYHQHQQYAQYQQDNLFNGPLDFSQPATPVMINYATPISPPNETTFQQQCVASMPVAPHQPGYMQQYSPTMITPTSFFPNYDTPLMSPTAHGPMESQLPRAASMDMFNFRSETQYPSTRNFASAPGSGMTTPLNLSRPVSPTWEQGPSSKRNRAGSRYVYFYIDEDEADGGQALYDAFFNQS